MFFRILDYFIGQLFKEDIDLYFKVRLLVGALLSFICSIPLFLLFYVIGIKLPMFAVLWTAALAVPPMFLWVYLLTLLRKGEAYVFASNACLASLSFILFAGIAITGGPEKTEVHPFIMIPPIAAFLLLGQRAGVIWALINLVIFYVFVAIDPDQFINIPPEEYRTILRVVNWTYAFLTTIALVWIYEMINRRITRERDAEREKFKYIAEVAVESSVMTESADKLADSGDNLLDAAIKQKAAIEQLAVTTEELGATAEQNARLTSEAKTAIANTENHLLVSTADILQLVESMNQVQASSDEIQSINNLINEISYQTNILSLNAMIEASRSSEGSGGFKVVALEVKKLAQRSADAADSINKLLASNKVSVEQGLQLSETMRLRFEEISEMVTPLAEMIQNVTDASHEQNEAIRQITEGLNDIDKAIARSEEMAKGSSETARELRSNANELIELVNNVGAKLDIQ